MTEVFGGVSAYRLYFAGFEPNVNAQLYIRYGRMSCACKVQVAIHKSIGIAWLRGVSVGKFAANRGVFLRLRRVFVGRPWPHLLTRAPSYTIHHPKLID